MKIKLTESKLKQIVAESVKKVLNESISTDYHNTLKQLLAKSFNNLNENEKQFLYDLLNNEPWEIIYTALNILGQNRVNEGSDVLNEIGDTLKGQFALGAVRGRASARPRYQNNKYGGLHTKSQQDNIANNAADASWENRKDLDINKSREMNNAEQRGYYYGFEKGMTN